MKQHTFKLHLGYNPLDGTNITVKSESESLARKEVIRILKTATRDMKPESLEFLGTGRMTPARMVKIDAQRLGSLGGIHRLPDRSILGITLSPSASALLTVRPR